MSEQNNYGRCVLCGGEVCEKRASMTCYKKEKFIAIIDDIPTGVCDQCGYKSYKVSVAKNIEKLLAQPKDSWKRIKVPSITYTPPPDP